MDRLTATRRRILEGIYDSAPDAVYGLEISRMAQISSGSLYPALRDLRKAGLVETEWRAPEDDPEGQPLRYYTLSPNGFALVKALSAGTVEGTGWRKFLPATMRWALR